MCGIRPSEQLLLFCLELGVAQLALVVEPGQRGQLGGGALDSRSAP